MTAQPTTIEALPTVGTVLRLGGHFHGSPDDYYVVECHERDIALLKGFYYGCRSIAVGQTLRHMEVMQMRPIASLSEALGEEVENPYLSEVEVAVVEKSDDVHLYCGGRVEKYLLVRFPAQNRLSWWYLSRETHGPKEGTLRVSIPA